MQIKNVYYAEQPEAVIVNERGGKAVVEMPVGVTEIETEDRHEWLAETVYYIETTSTPSLKERVEAEYEDWLEIAKYPVPQPASIADVVDALNALTEIVIGEA